MSPFTNFFWMVVLFAVAILILLLNDKTKSEAERKCEKNPIKSPLLLFIGMVAFMGYLLLMGLYEEQLPFLRWGFNAFFAVLAICLSCVFLFYFYCIYVCFRYKGKVRCPKCSKLQKIIPGQVGDIAFECTRCGERAFWMDPEKMQEQQTEETEEDTTLMQ